MEGHDTTIRQTEFFTTSELAEKLKMNVQVITRKVQAGEIAAYKIGKEWRIPEQSVIDWLERNSNKRNGGLTRLTLLGGPRAIEAAVPGDGEALHALRPAARTKRKYLLEYILAQFEPNRSYSQQEVDRIIGRFNADFEAVRSEFVEEKMMDMVDGSYRRRQGYRLHG